MKTDKQNIVSTTIMFLVIVSVVILFKSIFGDENVLVAVAGITAALSLLGTDYTIHPIKNTIYFVVLESALGLAAYIASLNFVLGLIITFVVIFYILYSFTYNTKKPTYVAFTLGYFFMLYTPVNSTQLPTRLAGLVFCGLSIMALQMLANKNKLNKECKTILNNSIKSIIKEIDFMINSKIVNKKNNNINTNINNNIKNLISDIYKRIDENIKLPQSLMQALFISKCIESINLTLGKMQDEDYISKGYENSLKTIKNILININDFIDKKLTTDEIIEKLESFYIDNIDNNSKYYLTFELQDTINILIDDLRTMRDEDIEQIHKKYFVPNITSKLNNLKNNMHKDSLKFTFALRGAIVTSVGVCLVSALNLEYGRWLIFSLISIVQPYIESSKVKAKDRIIGTVIGLIIFEIIFNVVTDISARTMVILLVGYLSNYQTKYKNQMMCTTISALGSASMTADIVSISFERISFVVLGTIIALLANKLILPYKMSEITKKEIKESIKLNEKILSKLYDLGISKSSLDDEIKQLMVTNELLNKKILINNESLLSSNIDKFIYNQILFMNNIKFLINNFKKFTQYNVNTVRLFYDIDRLTQKDDSKEETIKYFNKIEDNYTKLILINVVELNDNIIKSKLILKDAVNEIK